MTAAATRTARRPRRFDPDRKERIIEATLDVIAEHGVAGTTHRLIAEAADVPLGSLTYHFESLAALREQAFRRHAERMTVLYEQHFDHVRTRRQLIEAITQLVHDNNASSTQESIITFELYTAARRDPSLRQITEAWMAASRVVLQRYIDPTTARGVDALIEGLIMHTILSTDPHPRTHTARYVEQALGDAVINTPASRKP
jgi:DNA-binding transcriptional regulator YbjK